MSVLDLTLEFEQISLQNLSFMSPIIEYQGLTFLTLHLKYFLILLQY